MKRAGLRRLPVRFIPTSLYIDELGVIRNKYIGPMDLQTLLKFTGIDS